MLPILRAFALAGAAALALLPAQGRAAEKLDVVASFSVIGDFASEVGGDRVNVVTLVGPNGDAHTYEPKPADAVAMAKADVILVNGLHFEGFLRRLVDASGTSAPVVELTRGVEPIRMKPEFAEGEEAHAAGEAQDHDHDHDHDHGADGDTDPHAFQSIANARLYVRNVAEAFCAADAEGCASYEANAETYLGKLDALEGEVKADVAEIPAERRTIITSHDAFGYFEHAYGLVFRAPEGLSTEAEPSAADVARLIGEIRAEKASAVFVENITNPRLVEQLAAETGLKVGGELFSDALSDASGPAATYLDMMRHNIRTIKGAVLGS